MSEFCNQCARDHGFQEGDFKGVGDPADLPLKVGEGFPVICEGCGFVLVDAEGNCIGGEECSEEHHKKAAVSEAPAEPSAEDRMRGRQRFTREQHDRRDGTTKLRKESL